MSPEGIPFRWLTALWCHFVQCIHHIQQSCIVHEDAKGLSTSQEQRRALVAWGMRNKVSIVLIPITLDKMNRHCKIIFSPACHFALSLEKRKTPVYSNQQYKWSIKKKKKKDIQICMHVHTHKSIAICSKRSHAGFTLLFVTTETLFQNRMWCQLQKNVFILQKGPIYKRSFGDALHCRVTLPMDCLLQPLFIKCRLRCGACSMSQSFWT